MHHLVTPAAWATCLNRAAGFLRGLS